MSITGQSMIVSPSICYRVFQMVCSVGMRKKERKGALASVVQDVLKRGVEGC